MSPRFICSSCLRHASLTLRCGSQSSLPKIRNFVTTTARSDPATETAFERSPVPNNFVDLAQVSQESEQASKTKEIRIPPKYKYGAVPEVSKYAAIKARRRLQQKTTGELAPKAAREGTDKSTGETSDGKLPPVVTGRNGAEVDNRATRKPAKALAAQKAKAPEIRSAAAGSARRHLGWQVPVSAEARKELELLHEVAHSDFTRIDLSKINIDELPFSKVRNRFATRVMEESDNKQLADRLIMLLSSHVPTFGKVKELIAAMLENDDTSGGSAEETSSPLTETAKDGTRESSQFHTEEQEVGTRESPPLRPGLVEEKASSKDQTPVIRLNIPELDRRQVKTLNGRNVAIIPIHTEPAPQVRQLSFDLSRVLFNPGVYQLQDPRSRVYNFDPYLQNIMPVNEFNFDALNGFVSAFGDSTLRDVAIQNGKKYIGSSSSMTSVLSQFHFLLSAFRKLNFETLSRKFQLSSSTFTKITTGPTSVFLRYKDGVYATDPDRYHDSGNILMSMGKSMEKLLTLSKEEFEQYRKSSGGDVNIDNEPEQYHYGTIGNVLIRSQLDAHDPRLPGTGMFDLKTRAVAAIRMNLSDYEAGLGYQIKDRFGSWESFEREYYDMMRATMLKYSLQARIGRMDGIFVAYHNIERLFGFQYISLPEMDLGLHGQSDTSLGDREFGFSVRMLEDVFDRATARFPEQTLRFHFEAREATEVREPVTYMHVYAEPVSEELVDRIQKEASDKVEEYERRVTGRERTATEVKGGNDLNTADQAYSGEPQYVAASPYPSQESEDLAVAAAKQSATDTGTSIEALEEDYQDVVDVSQELESLDTVSSEDSTIRSVATSRLEADGDSSFLDSLESIDLSELPTTPQPETPRAEAAEAAPLLAMKIVVRHEVNGQHVGRPQNLSADDIWSVDYTVEELPPTTARVQFQMCKRRRAKIYEQLNKTRDEDNNLFLRRLLDLSKEGRQWRKEMDDLDAGRETVVL